MAKTRMTASAETAATRQRPLTVMSAERALAWRRVVKGTHKTSHFKLNNNGSASITIRLGVRQGAVQTTRALVAASRPPRPRAGSGALWGSSAAGSSAAARARFG